MNYYVEIIEEVVDYIELHLEEKLSLSHLAEHFGISDFHFNRIFKTISGITLKQYILGRKLSKAMELLTETERSILTITYDLGFDYPESFSRAFKKQYGIAPSQFREGSSVLEGIPKAHLIERDIINYRGVLALKGKCIFMEELILIGISTDTNVKDEDFQDKLASRTQSFLTTTEGMTSMCRDMFYTVVNCRGEENGDYTVFCGKKPTEGELPEGYQKRRIPGGWYVSFQYLGDMFDIKDTFIDELYRWVMVKEAKLKPNGIGMLNIYDKDYLRNQSIEILVPIEEPV